MKKEEIAKMLRNNIKIVNHYDLKTQMFVWIEEMSELIKVICKWARKYDELEGDITPQLMADFYNEIPDVTICLDQMKYILHFKEDDLMKEYKFKVDRQLERIENENRSKNIS